MDCSNNQWGACTRRPQMPQPPCMNTNCGCDCSESLRPTRPICSGMSAPIMPLPEVMPPVREPRMREKESAMTMREERMPEQGRRMPMREERMPERERRMPMSEERMPERGWTMPMREERMPEQGCRMSRREDQMAILSGLPIGMAYVPWQRWCQTYPMEQALDRGTIFPELDLPFVMGRCRG